MFREDVLARYRPPARCLSRRVRRPRRVHFPRLECRTDATHVLRCLLGTGVRLVNWALAASAGVSAMCLAFGVSRNVLVCRLFEARARSALRLVPLAAAAVRDVFVVRRACGVSRNALV